MPLNRLVWVTPNWGFDSADASGDFGCIKAGNISVSNSMLNLVVNHENATGQNANVGTYQGTTISATYTYGLVYSTFSFLYGTVEIRCQMSGGTGDWPALWMINQQCAGQYFNRVPAPNYAQEIDIAEIHPAQDSTFQTVNQACFSGAWTMLTTTTADVRSNFHIYKIVWSVGQILFYIDGTLTNTIITNVPNEALFIVMGQSGIGITNPSGPPNPADYPQTMQVDYVKVTGPDGVVQFFDDFL